MGKVKQRRQRSSRFNPFGFSEAENNTLLDGQEIDCTVSAATATANPREGLKVIDEKLSSAVSEERLSGLNTLAALALEEDTGNCIISSNIVRKASLLLKDPNPEVRLVAAGALRNLSAGGSDEVVESMVAQDVLTPLAELLQEYRSEWSPSLNDFGQPSARDIDPMTNIFIHATHCFLNLCECSEEALRVFNQEGLVHILLRHIDPSLWGHNLALAAAECLLCISENNPTVQTVLLPAADSLVLFISRPADTAVDLHYATTVAVLLMNINYCTSNSDNFRLVLHLLSKVLETNAVTYLEEYADHLKSSTESKPAISPQDIEHFILSQQLALEILSNICCSEDEEEWDECDTPSDSEAENGIEESMDTGSKSELSSEIQEGIAHFQLFQKSLQKVQYPEEHTCQILNDAKYGPSLLEKLSALQVRALLSLQNMISALDLSEIGGTDLLYSTWVNLGNMVFKHQCSDHILEAATGAMRAIMEKLSQDTCEKLSEITQQDLKIILEAGVGCAIPSVRANLTRMVGMLGCLLVSQNKEESLYNEQCTTVLSAITEFLLKVASQDTELWVSAEALDVIIDLFSDDKTDKLASMTYLVDSLKSIQPTFKSRYQKQKKKLGDHRPLVLTVKDNLLAFIKYKAPRAAKYKNI
ncbi:hypothetical protein SK128_002158 [Halocaridina rubra]|uniref:SYO1-like TPR repeats domain-containing protein n=1 Tax=Halocaridina rubra TaxID=373956 RepID=A0AAN9ACK8_HALRR